MKKSEELQKELKQLDKRLEGTFREVCPTRKRGMAELNKRDIEKILRERSIIENKSEEEIVFIETLKKARLALSSSLKDSVDISVDQAKTQLTIGIYELKDLVN